VKVQICSRWDRGKILWGGEAESLREAVVKAVAADAYLARADLADANLADANLAGANLARAYLAGANLADANLAGAYLADANLAGANLAGANLAGTALAPARSPYDWAMDAKCEFRLEGLRVMVLASRTIGQPHMRGPSYERGKVYAAPVFSRDAMSECHPGLYIEGGPESVPEQNRLLVACWLDELFVVSKCRVPRFRTLRNKEEFYQITAEDLEVEKE